MKSVTFTDRPASGRKQRGATAIEYGLIVAIIAVSAIPMMQWIGDVNSQRVSKAAYGMGAPATP